MKILFLGPEKNHRIGLAIQQKTPEIEVDCCERVLSWTSEETAELRQYAGIVSYGHRCRLLSRELEAVDYRAINLHISYLPWCRGADPLLWSIIEATPIGVTVHRIDNYLDTGAIIAQERVYLAPDDTFRTAHARLSGAVETLFLRIWHPQLLSAKDSRGFEFNTPQPWGGSEHVALLRKDVEWLLPQGWDTPIADTQRVLRGEGGYHETVDTDS